jgi:hypothetical protein
LALSVEYQVSSAMRYAKYLDARVDAARKEMAALTT